MATAEIRLIQRQVDSLADELRMVPSRWPAIRRINPFKAMGGQTLETIGTSTFPGIASHSSLPSYLPVQTPVDGTTYSGIGYGQLLETSELVWVYNPNNMRLFRGKYAFSGYDLQLPYGSISGPYATVYFVTWV